MTDRIITTDDASLDLVWKVLNREVEIDAVRFLRESVGRRDRTDPTPEQRTAFGFDTNALYRLGLGKNGANAIDYISALHKGPLLIPGQAVQELWNNQLAGVPTLAKGIGGKFDELCKEVEKLGQSFGDLGSEVKSAIDALAREYSHLYDPAALESFHETITVFESRAAARFVPRDRFAALAEVRNSTKTPPGFKDVGNGDFYIWADFLYGLAESGGEFDVSILVTNDVKPDWSRNGFPHPILMAEAEAVSGKPFSIWTLPEFHGYVQKFSVPNM